jgi:hypothetical protein
MTANHARKNAIRDRKAATGENYMQAARNVAAPANAASELLALERAVYASDDVKSQIAREFFSTANWRDGKAGEYPDDSRNASAAEHMYRIAAELIALADNDPRLSRVEEAWEACLQAGSFPDTISMIIRSYGFGWGGHGHYSPDLSEVLTRYADELEFSVR